MRCLLTRAVVFAIAVLAPGPATAQDRASQRAMAELTPFLGTWAATLPEGETLCDWSLIHQGTVLRSQCWPAGEDAEGEPVVIDLLHWHPGQQRIVFQRFEYQNPDDLLFDGWYRMESSTGLAREYLGYYGDGSIGFYRQTYTLETADRMVIRTFAMSRRVWNEIFEPLVYTRRGP